MKVRATRLGFYDLKRRREGDVFSIENERQFSEKWMARVPDTAAEVAVIPEKRGPGRPPKPRDPDEA